MANTIHLMKKDVETLQTQMKLVMQDIMDLKVKVSSVSAELCENEKPKSRTEQQDVTEKCLKTVEDQRKTSDSFKEAMRAQAEGGKFKFKPDKLVDEKDADGKTQLHRAVEDRDLIKIILLLRKHADANIGDRNGQTPLHRAIVKGYHDVCTLLLLMGNANVNEKNEDGKTQLQLAVEDRDITKITMLLKCGANADIGSHGKRTPLHIAAGKGYGDVCALLLSMGNGNANGQTSSTKSTPLHWAARNGHMAVVEVLIKCGVDVSIKNSVGKTAYVEAAEHGHKDVARYLDFASSNNMFSSTL